MRPDIIAFACSFNDIISPTEGLAAAHDLLWQVPSPCWIIVAIAHWLSRDCLPRPHCASAATQICRRSGEYTIAEQSDRHRDQAVELADGYPLGSDRAALKSSGLSGCSISRKVCNWGIENAPERHTERSSPMN